jgi:hypothetical protein
MLQQTAQSALERDLIRLLWELIPRNMDIMPPARRRPREIAEVPEVIGAHAHVDHAHSMTHGFEPVELIEPRGAPGDVHEMLRFINDDRPHPTPRHGLFQGRAQLGRVMEGGHAAPGLRLPGLALMEINDAGFPVEGFPSLDQCGAVIVATVEGAPIRDSGFQHQQRRDQRGLRPIQHARASAERRPGRPGLSSGQERGQRRRHALEDRGFPDARGAIE